MTIESIATKINEEIGMEGMELQTATFLIAMMYADVMGDKETGDYFQKRMRESYAKI